jgi:hypothetical protein
LKDDVARLNDAASVTRRLEQRRSVDDCSSRVIGGNVDDLESARIAFVITIYILARQVQLLVLIVMFDVPRHRKLDCFAQESLLNSMSLHVIVEYIVVARISPAKWD